MKDMVTEANTTDEEKPPCQCHGCLHERDRLEKEGNTPQMSDKTESIRFQKYYDELKVRVARDMRDRGFKLREIQICATLGTGTLHSKGETFN